MEVQAKSSIAERRTRPPMLFLFAHVDAFLDCHLLHHAIATTLSFGCPRPKDPRVRACGSFQQQLATLLLCPVHLAHKPSSGPLPTPTCFELLALIDYYRSVVLRLKAGQLPFGLLFKSVARIALYFGLGRRSLFECSISEYLMSLSYKERQANTSRALGCFQWIKNGR